MATRAPERPGAEHWVPPDAGPDALRAAAPGCRGCELWADATQVVFSAGPDDARIILVGEQPGDVEDREGEPFVGPAGAVLAEALGCEVRIGAERGRPLGEIGLDSRELRVLVTAHPSAVLRRRGKPEWQDAFAELVADLRAAAVTSGGAPGP